MRLRNPMTAMLRRLRTRPGSEDGFAIIIALGVLVVTSLIAAAAYAAVQADAPLGQRDLDGKKAYYAARAGVNAFLYELNQNPMYWQTCPDRAKTPIAPGATQYYSYKWIAANGKPACDPAIRQNGTNGDPITTMIDAETGTFRMKFIGYSGNATTGTEVQRGLIASFRKDTPLDFLWFTKYETLDPATYNDPTQYADCAGYAAGRPNTAQTFPPTRADHCVEINWIHGDRLNGPAHTEDQYLVPSGSDAIFCRSNTNDLIESTVIGSADDICQGTAATGKCHGAQFRGTPTPNAPSILPPADNTLLLTDATKFGKVYSGVTFITLNDTTATVKNCPNSGCTTFAPFTIDKFGSGTPLIYVKDDTTSSPLCDNKYSPYHPSYPATGACGTVYVKGTYTRSLTIAAQSDIIINGNIVRNGGAPAPVLGLTANNFVRVRHEINPTRPSTADQGQCGSPGTEAGTNGTNYFKNLQIDAAILAIKHSFIVDNYDCGSASNLLDLTINGAIAQTFRGTVGTGGGSGADTGYLKDYNYDNRLAVAQPPYLFDIASASWHIDRETLCVPAGASPTTTCDPSP
jgi:hypothetical protein